MSGNYKEDIKIDFNNLHINWRDHADNMLDWGEQWANAKAERHHRRRFLNQDIRKNPDKYGLPEYPSEAAVTMTIKCDEKYIDLRKTEDTLGTVKDAFYQRRSGLEGVMKLFLQGYYNTNLSDEVEAVRKEQKQEKEERVQGHQREHIQKIHKRLGGQKNG